jgi:hypothetical protein
MKKPIAINPEKNNNLIFPEELSSHILTHAYLYLQPNGWFNDTPCDEDGTTPWYTFSAIKFLKDIIKREWTVFEYGSGYSTLFFKNNVQKLVSVEHSEEWYNYIKTECLDLNIELAPQNTEIHPEASNCYNNFIQNFKQIRTHNFDHDLMHGLINDEFAGYASKIYISPAKHFDLVVIDGMARALCAVMTVESHRLKDDGIIILDNSDRWQYNPIQEYLIQHGFGRIDFYGSGWNNHAGWCTSFYSKSFPINNNNVLRKETASYINT